MGNGNTSVILIELVLGAELYDEEKPSEG